MKDSLIVSRDHTRSIKQYRDSLPIHVDLVMEIFSRLPAKSVARYRCLSKFWDILFRSQYFIDLFAANSYFRPQILFASRNNESNYSFFSAHQPPSENSCDDISPTQLKNFPLDSSNCYGFGLPINGLVCLDKFIDDMSMSSVQVIYNPTTGEFLNLPEVNPRWTGDPLTSPFLGYDPTEKQFKVLCVLCYGALWLQPEGHVDNGFAEYQVLTLETEKLSWRMIECDKPHTLSCSRSRICINGVLYYRGTCASNVEVIVCFDLRSETFRFIKVMETFNKKNLGWSSLLTNFNGKLGLLIPEEPHMTGESISFELWVLKDAQNHEWSKHVYVLPPSWKKVVGETKLFFVGMIGTNEIVLSSSSYYDSIVSHVPLYIFYYNTEKDTIRRLTIQGLEASTLQQFYIFLNHVENNKCNLCLWILDGSNVHDGSTIILGGIKKKNNSAILVCEGSTKLHKRVKFPLELNLGRNLLVSPTNESLRYELVATISTHHGRDPSKGHYTTDAQRKNGQWLRFDDASVTAIGTKQVLHDQAYVLFYKQV